MTKRIVNKFKWRCGGCGASVPERAGFAEKNLSEPGSGWTVLCSTCAGEPASTEPSAPESAPTAAAAPSSPDVEPTDEQREALRLFGTGASFVIEAGAGCGKTSTAKMLAESTTRPGAFMAFNRAIVDDARKKMPATMTVKTIHGYAFAAVGKHFQGRFKSERVSSTQIARRLGIDPYAIRYGTETKVVQPGFLAGHVLKAAKRFCNSEDPVPGEQHFAYIDGVDVPDAQGRRTYEHNDRLRRILLPALEAVWADWQNPSGTLRYEQDAYVKMFALGDATIPVRYIVVDEAQDLTGVMVQILRKNQARGVQVVAIGDSAQVIYQWRGTVSVFDEPYRSELFFGGRTTLSMSFRFGQAIADVANLLLAQAGAPLRLVGNQDRESTVGAGLTNALMCRTNAGTISAMFRAIGENRSFHLVGGGADVVAFARGAQELQLTGRTEHPELACFSSWNQVLDYVENDPQGDELKLMVQTIDEHGAEKIIEALGRQAKIDAADLVLSTVHKSKGLEFDRVALGPDFPNPGTRGQESEAEWRLLYVAATRAKVHLDPTGCGPVLDLVDPPEDAAEPSVVVESEPGRPVAPVAPIVSGITDLLDR